MLILFLFFKHFFGSRNSLFFPLYTHTSAKKQFFFFNHRRQKTETLTFTISPCANAFSARIFPVKNRVKSEQSEDEVCQNQPCFFLKNLHPEQFVKTQILARKKKLPQKNTGSFPTKSESFTLNVGKFLTFQNTQTRRFRRLPHEVRMEHLGSCYLEPIDFGGIEEAA